VLEEGKAIVVAGADTGCFGASSASMASRQRQKYIEAKEDNFIVNNVLCVDFRQDLQNN